MSPGPYPASKAPPEPCIEMGLSPFPLTKQKQKGEAFCLSFLFGAGDRTRTGTPSLAVDFESTTSTIPSHRLIYRNSIHHRSKNSKDYF